MHHYKFPIIQHLDDVRPAIEGRDEFIIAERDWGFVVNYLVNLIDTFPSVNTTGGSAKMREEQSRLKAIRRECRGILFYPDGTIMARRFQKFFNVGEKEETQPHLIDFNQPHVILEKLDGSMITPVIMSNVPDERLCRTRDTGEQITRVGEMRWGTKMGLTDTSKQVEDFVKKNHRYDEFARWCIDYCGSTPIFEWCSRKQRIVIDYPNDRLVLTAVRETKTGNYKSLSWMNAYGAKYGIDVVKAYAGTANSMENLLTETRDLKGAEGWVIRFDDGHMIKAKSESYISMHRAKDEIIAEKNVINLIVNNKLDDFKSLVTIEDCKNLSNFEDNFWRGINKTVARYNSIWKEICSQNLDRKKFAIEYLPNLKNSDQNVATIVFGLFSGRDIRSMIIDLIKKNSSTQSKIDQVRYLWGNHRWDYHFEDDN